MQSLHFEISKIETTVHSDVSFNYPIIRHLTCMLAFLSNFLGPKSNNDQKCIPIILYYFQKFACWGDGRKLLKKK